MTSFPSFLALAIIWPGLVWCAVTAFRGQQQLDDWPAFWWSAVMVSVLPVAVYCFLMVVPGANPIGAFLPAGTGLTEFLSPNGAELDAISGADSRGGVVGGALALIIVGVLFVGALRELTGIIRGKLRLRSILQKATYDPELDVWRTTEQVSPCAVAGEMPKVIFPEYLLASLSPIQIEMIARHERAHLTYHDPLWSNVFAAFKAVFWFSPFLRNLIGQWKQAVELRSDAVACAGQSEGDRKAYAESLITTISSIAVGNQHAMPTAAFFNNNLRSEKMRITGIISGRSVLRTSMTSRLKLLAGTSLFAVVGCAGAAAVSGAASDNQTSMLAEDRVQQKTEIIINRNGVEQRFSYEDLSDEERAEIDVELARVEAELAKAGFDLDMAKEDMESALVELKVHEDFAQNGIDVETRTERKIVIEMEHAQDEIANAQEEIERAREEIESERKAVKKMRYVIRETSEHSTESEQKN